MIRPIKHIISPLAAMALLLSVGKQASAALVNPQWCTTPQGCWAYSLKQNIGQGGSSSYYPTSISELAGAVYQGDVTYDPIFTNQEYPLGPLDAIPTAWAVNGQDDLYLFSTMVKSSTDQTIPLFLVGDDGHSVFINDNFVAGGGFAQRVTYNLSLQADIPVKLTATLYQGPTAGSSYWFNPPGGVVDGMLDLLGILPNGKGVQIQEVPGIQITTVETPQPEIFIFGPGGGGTGSRIDNTLTWNEFFTGVGPSKSLDKVFNAAAANQTYTYNVNVRNNSGLTWTDFHLEILGNQAGTQVSFLNPPGTSSVFSTGTGNGTTINWTGGTVADDVAFAFQIQTGTGFQGDTFTVRQYATAVPEPLTILGTGVVLGALPVLKKEYAKRKKKKDGNA